MTGNNRLEFLFLNLGHLYDHLFILIYATVAALVLPVAFDMSYAELIVYATPGFIAFGVFALPAGAAQTLDLSLKFSCELLDQFFAAQKDVAQTAQHAFFQRGGLNAGRAVASSALAARRAGIPLPVDDCH